MRRLRGWVGWLACALLLGACAQLTEVVVVVDTDLRIPQEIDAFRIEVRTPNGDELHSDAILRVDSAPQLPRTLGIVHRGGPLEPLTVHVKGLSGGNLVIERRAQLAFQPGRVIVLRMDLLRSCLGMRSCSTEQTCVEGVCQTINVDSGELPDWDGPVDRLDASSPDAGQDAGAGPDAGQDAGADACVAADERCNGLDDDCDGRLDEGFNLATDPMNCGWCGRSCGANATCSSGSCVCSSGYANCDSNPANGCEVNTDADSMNCGRCGRSCGANATCSRGSCECRSGYANCDGTFANGCEVNIRTHPMHCGSCGRSCSSGAMCCGGTCDISCL
jgi:hypothetical protein